MPAEVSVSGPVKTVTAGKTVVVSAGRGPRVVIAGGSGPQGPRGLTGPAGPPGPPGAGSGVYTFTQPTPAATWIIDHNLDTYPTVTVVDSSGREWLVDWAYDGPNRVVVSMGGGFSGKAYLRY